MSGSVSKTTPGDGSDDNVRDSRLRDLVDGLTELADRGGVGDDRRADDAGAAGEPQDPLGGELADQLAGMFHMVGLEAGRRLVREGEQRDDVVNVSISALIDELKSGFHRALGEVAPGEARARVQLVEMRPSEVEGKVPGNDVVCRVARDVLGHIEPDPECRRQHVRLLTHVLDNGNTTPLALAQADLDVRDPDLFNQINAYLAVLTHMVVVPTIMDLARADADEQGQRQVMMNDLMAATAMMPAHISAWMMAMVGAEGADKMLAQAETHLSAIRLEASRLARTLADSGDCGEA